MYHSFYCCERAPKLGTAPYTSWDNHGPGSIALSPHYSLMILSASAYVAPLACPYYLSALTPIAKSTFHTLPLSF